MKDFEKITQRELEDFLAAYHEFGGGNIKNAAAQDAGATARALVKLGFEEIDVDNASPRDIMKYHVDTFKGINKALAPITKN